MPNYDRRLLLLGAAFFLSTGCDSKSRGETPISPARVDATVAEESHAEIEAKPPEIAELQAYTDDIPGDGRLFAVLKTDHGSIRCELFPDSAPRAVASFVGLARGLKPWRDPETDLVVSGRSFYEGVAFHYVVPGFFIQAGDRTGTGKSGPGYTFEDEFSENLRHDQPGRLSMANRGPNTNSSQFFITEKALPHLDGRHTIFGTCGDLETVKAIARLPTEQGERPENPARILSISFEKMP